jgi:outer membrane protein insertion porin family
VKKFAAARLLIGMSILISTLLYAAPIKSPEVIVDIKVKGNAKVESEAIITLLKTQKGDALDPAKVKEDINELYDLGYFSDIRFLKEESGAGVTVVIQVEEKPAIVGIKYEGLGELSEDDFKEKIETKLYTIVNESTITADLRVIEKQYTDKGYYLAKATYKLDKVGENEVDLTFQISEGGLVQVGSVDILGNKFYTESDIVNKLFSRPLTRMSTFSSPGSLFQDDFLKRDLEFISYYYRDQGFAEVKIAKPITLLDQDREFVRLTFEVEEGLQYWVGKINVSGDLLFPKEELIEAMQLKSGELFRVSKFQKDVDTLVDKYGDLGYAFVDVNPKTKFNRDEKPHPTVDLDYEITKGDKVYFGDLTIVGNSKTRDNVIRRELEVHDSQLYSGTRLTKSKQNIERLGFFEEVQAIKNRDTDDPTLLHYKFKVKEKPTGQLQAAIGFQPGQASTENKWFGQGRYNEENQSGYGWKTNLTGKWNGQKNYSVETGFTNPRVNDSQWLLGFSAFVNNKVRDLTDDISIEEREIGGSVKIGRKIIELIRGSITYQISEITTSSDSFIIDKFRKDGIKSSAIFGLGRNSTNNYLDPTEGSNVALNQTFTGGPVLQGDFQFMESSFDASQYVPIDFTETYRTYFHLHGHVSYIYPMSKNEPVPLLERYRLGGFNDLRGYEFNSIGPHYNLLQNPGGPRSRFNKGGDKQLYFQLEYFAPVIQEAGIKALVFADAGRVYDDEESIEFKDFHKDFGFGFRWITPIAPFRFEWAYPIENGKPGDMKFIFYLGY